MAIPVHPRFVLLCFVLLCFGVIIAWPVTAQSSSPPLFSPGPTATIQPSQPALTPEQENDLPANPDWKQKWPGLRIDDAEQALRMLRNTRFISRKLANNVYQTIPIRSIAARFVGRSRLPPPDADGKLETRWDLVLNGVDIDPREFFFSWDNRWVNLATLFSYGKEFKPENQAPLWDADNK